MNGTMVSQARNRKRYRRFVGAMLGAMWLINPDLALSGQVGGRPGPPGISPPPAQPLAPVPERKGFRLLKRPPVAYVPFELRDPRTGKSPVNPKTGQAITPETQITLPNGKTMTVKRYSDQFNLLERQFNSLGYSLRDETQGRIKIGEPTIDRAALQRQASAVAAKHLGVRGPRPDLLRDIGQLKVAARGRSIRDLIGTKLPIGVMQQLFCGSAKKPWDLPMGDPDSFYVNLAGELVLTGCKDGPQIKAGTEVRALGRVNTAVLGMRLELAGLNANLKSPKSEPMTASVELRILGNTIPILNESSATAKEWEGQKSQPVNYSFPKIRFQVGPVPMSVEFGVRGEGGIRYSLGLQPGTVIGGVIPFAHSEAWARANAIDFEITSAGAEGKIVLVNDDLDLKAIAQLQFTPAPDLKPYVVLDYSAYNTMESLSGEVKLFACAWVLKWSWTKGLYWDEKCYYEPLVDWVGFKQTDYLFRQTEEIRL